MLLKAFEKDNVDCRHAARTNQPNNMLISIVTGNGERTMYAYNNVKLEAYPRALEDADAIVFTSIIHPGAIDYYIRIADKCRRAVKFLDPGNIFAQRPDIGKLADKVDCIFANEDEHKLMGKTLKPAIIKRGDRPVIYEGKEYPVPKARAVDTTGAGDCFDAAFIHSYLKGNSFENAIRFAVRAASASVAGKGARSMPRPALME
jgi:sugar/nucleoside kinase (ribokinase family)